MKSLTILAGYDKNGLKEAIASITLFPGDLYTIVGNTGSGKSRLIKDIEQLVIGDSISKRKVLLDGNAVSIENRAALSDTLVAHLSQNMRFVLDTDVKTFLTLHAKCRERSSIDVEEIIHTANTITPESIAAIQNLNTLSGGQTRALMIADIACICDSPIVLIDEIENAGIDKIKALKMLTQKQKLVLIVTHDIHTALMAKQRIVMHHGAIDCVIKRNEQEEQLFHQLSKDYTIHLKMQNSLRMGEHIL